MRRVLLACGLLLSPACAEQQPVHVPHADIGQQLVINGAPPNAPHHDAVVALFQVTGDTTYADPFCSGTLIAPDTVLTAAHCLDVASYGSPSFFTIDPSLVAVFVGDDPSVDFFQHTYEVIETLIHPGYSRVSLLNDIALVRLGVSVTEVGTVPHLPSSLGLTPADGGVLMNYAGFGEDELGNYGIKLQVDLPMGGPGCTVAGCQGQGSLTKQFSYSMNLGGPCFGDSGGPTFLDRSGTMYVAGITSYGDATCTQYGVQTRVDAYGDGLDAYLASRTVAPDAPGSGTCGDAVCNTGESCDGRDTTTSCLADCPGSSQGNPSQRFCTYGGGCIGEGC